MITKITQSPFLGLSADMQCMNDPMTILQLSVFDRLSRAKYRVILNF